MGASHRLQLAGICLFISLGSSAAERVPLGETTRYFDLPGEDGAYSIRGTADGGYILAGTTASPAGDRDLGMWKLNSAMDLDTGFAGSGWLRLGGSGDDQAADILEVLDSDGTPDGYLVVAYSDLMDGDFEGEQGRGKIDTLLLRLDKEGNLDPRWDGNGIRVWGGSGDDEPIVHHHNYTEPGDRVLQVDDGFIVVLHTRSDDGDLAGINTVGLANGRDAILLKVDHQGTPIADWAHQGVFRFGTDVGNQDRQDKANDFLFSVRQLRNGDLIAAGYTLGKSFTTDRLTVATRGNGDHQGTLMANDNPDLYKMDMMVLKLDPQGRLRDSWGDHGVVFIGGTRQEKGYDVHEDAKGRLLLTGRTSSFDLDVERPPAMSAGRDMLVFRLLPDGRPDLAFGYRGALTIDGASGQFQRVTTLADGRIVALGFTDYAGGVLALPGAPDLHRQGILAVLDDSGDLLHLYSLGMEGEDKPAGLWVDDKGRVLVSGFRIPDQIDDYEKEVNVIAQRQLWVSRYILPH